MTVTTIVVMVVAAIVGYFFVSGLFPDSTSSTKDGSAQDPFQKDDFQKDNTAKDTPFFKDESEPSLSAPILDQQYIRQHWHDILHVAITATRHEITQAYQQQLAQYHPQHFSGASADIQMLAAQHIQQIKAAYQHALNIKGFSDF